jgi:hypothetical protein
MPHPLVLALYKTHTAAAAGARAVHALGVGRDQISVVARTHDEAGALAEQMDASPGVDIEDSRPASRLGELGGQVLAAIALVLPGIGPIVAAGPLSADLGEAVGHAAGSLSSALTRAGVAHERAESLQQEIDQGAVLLAVHVTAGEVAAITRALGEAGAANVETASWPAAD